MADSEVMDSPQDYAEDAGYEGGQDYDGPEENGQPVAPGQGTSKSSRRRRRKRKNKQAGDGGVAQGGGDGGAAPVTIVMEGESISLAASAGGQQSRPQQGQSGGGQQNGQAQGQGKRWKKKFRDRERKQQGRSENPGNEAGSNGNGSYADRAERRRGGRPDNFGNLVNYSGKKNGGQNGGGRGFVGPMDHSYRETAEFGDRPPSTIQLHGRRNGHKHRGDSQPIDYNMPRPVPVPEGAQTHIYLFVEELFLVAKIQETAKKQGVKIAFVKNEKEDLERLLEGETDRPALIVFDLNNGNAKPMTLIPKLKSKLKKSVSVIGFLSVLQGDLKAKATEAGCDVVMTRAAFSQGLPNLLRRYGVEEQEEVNYNY